MCYRCFVSSSDVSTMVLVCYDVKIDHIEDVLMRNIDFGEKCIVEEADMKFVLFPGC